MCLVLDEGGELSLATRGRADMVDTMLRNAQLDQQEFAVLRGVTKRYGDAMALSEVDLTLAAGDHVAIVGRSGSGKSTLLNMLTGIDRPSAGSVRVAGVELGELDEGKLAAFRGRHVGIVFQFFQLVPTLTVRENVLLAMELVGAIARPAREARARELLAQVGIAAHADKLPAALSGGEQQRAALARALANDPAMLVADEPTGNLDSQTAEAVVSLFEGLVASGKTVVVVTHDPAVAARCARVVRISDGRVS